VAYQMAATAVTLNDLQGHSQLLAFSHAICRTSVQHFTRFQLTVPLHWLRFLYESGDYG